MRNITLWLAEGISGISLTIGLLFMMTGNEIIIMAGMFGSIIAFLPFLQMMMTAKQKNFLPFFFNLQEENGIKKEKFLLYPGRFGRLGVVIAKILSDKVCFVKGAGLIEDKGTEYSFGNSPLSWWEPGKGYTTNTRSAQYHNLLKKKERIKDYDEMIKAYLTSEDYIKFCQLFRMNPEPDAEMIDKEIQWLKDIKTPKNKLEFVILGETYSMQDDLPFMKYNYHPQTLKNFVENEKINVRREELGYKDKDKAISFARAFIYVCIGLVILIAVLSAVDLSNIGKLFGG
jgi:hypothetical protein